MKVTKIHFTLSPFHHCNYGNASILLTSRWLKLICQPLFANIVWTDYNERYTANCMRLWKNWMIFNFIPLSHVSTMKIHRGACSLFKFYPDIACFAVSPRSRILRPILNTVRFGNERERSTNCTGRATRNSHFAVRDVKLSAHAEEYTYVL